MCCAYGPLTTFPAITSSFALLFTFIAAFGCSLFQAGNNHASVGNWGLWRVEGVQVNLHVADSALVSDACYPYSQVVPFGNPSSFLDGPMKAGRAFSAIAAILAGPLWITILMLCCVNFGDNKSVFRVITIWCAVVAVMILFELVSAKCVACMFPRLVMPGG
jgi:hypothetical protein